MLKQISAIFSQAIYIYICRPSFPAGAVRADAIAVVRHTKQFTHHHFQDPIYK
jgi:hypothetical protein